ncbi:MAG TPA: ABC transporter ATP-binding protein [Methylophilaceae bacterium]|nr:ABC transporter ATP-binding protein [Methylophilaceae bacterium]
MSSNQSSVVVEGLSKRYLVPHRSESLSKMGKVAAHMREFFPFLSREDSDFFWALRDLSFEVKPGEILGILGHNGSGKSTLLKILSGVTQPSFGKAILRGKVGSLLEVGTGFHPDLTGRENVFMSGVLLGLKRQDIAAKFDEIVDFSGIEAFIDVPVKRYSSGMYVRLAYAVASMLSADILILDEVMAVGDAAFREKSKENIEKIANDGRTVLFVSHNARAVTSMCTTGMILEAGQCIYQGSAKDAVATYLRKVHHYDTDEALRNEAATFHDLDNAPRLLGGQKRVLRWVSTHRKDGTPSNRFNTGESLLVRIGYQGLKIPNPYFAVLIMNEFAERVATIHSTHHAGHIDWTESGVIECCIEDLRLGEGTYRIMLDFGIYGGSRMAVTSLDCVPNAAAIHIELSGFITGMGIDAYQGAVHKSAWRPLPYQELDIKSGN